jgi:hypothetical protein
VIIWILGEIGRGRLLFLHPILGATAYSLSQVKEWRSRFAAGDLSCQDQIRPGRPRHVLRKPFSDFLKEFSFASAGLIAEHFCFSKPTIKETRERELGLRRFSRRWVTHWLRESPKADRRTIVICILSVLRQQTAFSFSRIATGDESWFYIYTNPIMCSQRAEIK